jgi:acetyl-CoA synthetase
VSEETRAISNTDGPNSTYEYFAVCAIGFCLDNIPDCFKEYADLLHWYRPWDITLDTSNPPFWRWFVGGRINASYNCVDRHLAKYKNKTAFHFVPEPEHEAIQHVTYQELYVRVNEVAALLRDGCGLKKGDRVTLHMPMVPELPITMLACARLGVIHSQVFSGFSGKATADRIVDSESRVLITMDAYYRGGQLLDHKEKADVAVSRGTSGKLSSEVHSSDFFPRFRMPSTFSSILLRITSKASF